MKIPQDKIQDLEKTLRDMAGKSKVSKKALQSLVGKLNFATQCIYGGRFWGGESSLPVAHPGYQVLSDILFRLGLIVNALTQCSA